MAYDYQMGGGYIEGETPEEYEARRRREAAEQAQAQAQDLESGGITAQRPSLGDLASQYIGRRVDAAQQRVADAGQMFTDPQAALERRLGMTPQPDAANTEVQSQTVKTFQDGSQEHVVKTQTPASAPAPQAPAQTGGGNFIGGQIMAPDQSAAETNRLLQQNAQARPVPTAPVVPDQSAAESQRLLQQNAQASGVPTAPVVPEQQARSMQPAPAAQPFTGQGLQMPAGAPGGVPSLAASGAQAQAEESQGQRYADQINSGNLYSLLTTDSGAPRMVKLAAADKARDTLNQERIKADVETKVAALQDPREVLKVFDEFKRSKSEEGSYLRAYLLKRFGFDAAADDEMSKLGWGAKYEHTILEGGREALVKYSTKGEPIAGIDADGNRLTSKELIAAGSMKGAQTALSVGYDSKGNVISHRALPNGRGFIWKDETNQKVLSGAPEGYHQGKNQQEMLAISAYKQSMTNDEAANRRAREKGERAQYSEGQMLQRAENQRNLILGLPTTTYGGAGGANQVQATTVENPPAENKKATATGGANRVAATPVVSGGGQGTGGATGAPTSGAAPSAREAKMSTAQQIANFSLGPVKDPVIMAEVQRLNPDWSEGKFKAANKVRENFATLNPASAGGQLQAVNRAVPHLEQYRQTVMALNNGDMPKVNSILQLYDYNVGDDKVAAAKAIQNLVSTEIQKAVAGGLGGVAERHDLSSQLSTSLNDKQLNRVINEYQGLMAEQARGLKQNWTSHGLPASEFDQKLVPKARELLNRPEGGGAPKTPQELAREEQERRRKAQQ